jgi:hypothetical protein
MDLQSLALPGLVALGVVNVLTMFKPDIDSRIKFAASGLVAFGVLFVPAELGSMLADKVKQAIEIAFATSGLYKLATKAGGTQELEFPEVVPTPEPQTNIINPVTPPEIVNQ